MPYRLTAARIEGAIRAYKRNVRPYPFTKPRSWYVIGKDGAPYPLKFIYAIATKQPTPNFNTRVARNDLRRLNYEVEEISTTTSLDSPFEKQVRKAMKDSRQARQKRLRRAPRVPKSRIQRMIVFVRNPDVVAEVLLRAKGECEECGEKAPFRRKSDQSPYLEVHHRTQLAAGGEDTVENAVAVCPNCHRESHFG